MPVHPLDVPRPKASHSSAQWFYPPTLQSVPPGSNQRKRVPFLWVVGFPQYWQILGEVSNGGSFISASDKHLALKYAQLSMGTPIQKQPGRRRSQGQGYGSRRRQATSCCAPTAVRFIARDKEQVVYRETHPIGEFSSRVQKGCHPCACPRQPHACQKISDHHHQSRDEQEMSPDSRSCHVIKVLGQAHEPTAQIGGGGPALAAQVSSAVPFYWHLLTLILLAYPTTFFDCIRPDNWR